MAGHAKSLVIVGTIVAVGTIAAVGFRVLEPNSSAASSDDPTSVETSALSTVAVQRGDLVESATGVGEIGYGDAWAVAVDATGAVTDRSETGTIVESGQPLIWIDARPVVLVEGSTPMYRTLESVRDASGRFPTGPDVAQLQEFLISLGFDDEAQLEVDGVFGRSTTRAVKEWQSANGLVATGTVDRAQVVFHPGPLRVESEPRVGATFGELLVTDPVQQVTATFLATQRAFVPVGAEVILEVGAEEMIDGSITDVTDVVADDGARRLKVTVTAAAPLPQDADRAVVSTERVVASDVLYVPVSAVLALAGGGYGLEVSSPSGPELRAVDVGSVVANFVEVTGDYAEGDLVLVPIDAVGG